MSYFSDLDIEIQELKIYQDAAVCSNELGINLENWLCDDLTMHDITDLTPKQIVDEAKYVLSTFFESGHSNNDILNGEFPEDRKYAKKEVKALKAFIKKYDNKGN
jgi:hypothetical protein